MILQFCGVTRFICAIVSDCITIALLCRRRVNGTGQVVKSNVYAFISVYVKLSVLLPIPYCWPNGGDNVDAFGSFFFEFSGAKILCESFVKFWMWGSILAWIINSCYYFYVVRCPAKLYGLAPTNMWQRPRLQPRYPLILPVLSFFRSLMAFIK